MTADSETNPAAQPSDLPQGSLELLETPVARRLLASAIPARLAYTAKDGTPRIVPTWFRWTDGELVMPTYIQAPHIPAPGSRRLGALRARPDVAISIDTEAAAPQVLMVRGKAQITEVDGVDPDYADAARQYLGDQGAQELLDMVDQPGTRMARITVRPEWVGLLDFGAGRLPGAIAPP